MTLLQEYIVQQPALWRALLDSREEITGAFARRFGDLRPDRVVLIGSGSSHYAALMARPVLERAWGAEVTCLVPSEAAGARLTGERPLYLAISQSGVSTNTYELVTALTGAGHPVAAVTERADSPVGSAATLAVTLRIGEERIGAKTKGVTATVLTLMLLGLSVCRDETYRADMLAALDRLCRDAEENLARARAWSQARLAEILPFRHLYVLGCGSGLGAAREAALKLLETNYLPVSCYPLDEYLHGIQNALDESACLLCLLPPEGEDRSRMLRLRTSPGPWAPAAPCCPRTGAGRGRRSTCCTAGGRSCSLWSSCPPCRCLRRTSPPQGGSTPPGGGTRTSSPLWAARWKEPYVRKNDESPLFPAAGHHDADGLHHRGLHFAHPGLPGVQQPADRAGDDPGDPGGHPGQAPVGISQ